MDGLNIPKLIVTAIILYVVYRLCALAEAKLLGFEGMEVSIEAPIIAEP